MARRPGRSSIAASTLITTSSATSHPTVASCRRRFPRTRISQDILDGRVIASLKTPWQGRPAGALVAYSIPDLLAGRTPAIETVFIPNEHQAVEDVSASQSKLWVKYLEDVSGRLTALTRAADGTWSSAPVALPDKSTVHLNATAGTSDLAFATVEGMLTPPTLFRVEPAAAPVAIQSLPPQFDASNMVVEQHFATSPDGTKIPYFLVRRKDVTGPVPALIHAYGGFEVAQTPSYLVHEPYRSGPLALFWVQQGNAYVLANIRGGGEYGPKWHNAVLRENRQKAFDDLYAVADDLIARGVTQKGPTRRLGPLEWRAPRFGRHRTAARPVGRCDHRLAAGRHAAILAPARGRVVDG